MDLMSAYPASPPQNPNETKKPHTSRYIAVGLMATVAVIIIIIASGAFSSTAENNTNCVPTPYTVSVISESIVLNPDGYYFTGFSVPEGALNPILQGNFTSAGNSTNNNAIVTVWSQKEFINWLSCRNCSPCYNRDMMPMVAGKINVTVSSGQYFIVFSSATYKQAKTVTAQIDLTYCK